jgi:predicted porin
MQKKLIALAVAGLVAAPVAMAQSNVTIYGVVDAYLGYSKTGSAKKTVINGGGLSGSRIGFRGTEDLGNGLKAVFTLEYALANDVNEGIGTGALRARQQFVGLQGGFGTVSLGRQYAPGFGVFKFDAAMGASPFSPQSILSVQNGMSITPNSPARWDNSINWKSANMNGFTAQVIYGLSEVNELSNRRDGDKFGVNLDYTNGPLAVGVIYHQRKETGLSWSDWGVSPYVGNNKEWLLGATYDFGAAKLYGSYQQQKVDGYKGKLWNLGVSAPVGAAGSVFLAYADFDTNESGKTDASSWALGYTHAMSKRTTVYAAYSTVRNDSWRAIQVNTTAGGDGDNNHNYVLGLRHTF